MSVDTRPQARPGIGVATDTSQEGQYATDDGPEPHDEPYVRPNYLLVVDPKSLPDSMHQIKINTVKLWNEKSLGRSKNRLRKNDHLVP